MRVTNRLGVLVLSALAAAGLAGCEAGTMDTDTGRFAAAETRTQDTQAETNAKRDADDTADDRSAKDEDSASANSDAASAAAAFAQADLDAQGQVEPLPEVLAHQGISREYPELPKDLVLPESVAAAVAAAAAGAQPDPNNPPIIDAVSPAHAPASGGSELEIHGKNLHAYQVAVGFAPARILAVREAGGTVTLTVAAPPRTGPATVAVVVMNRDGSSAVAAEPFQYLN